MKFFRLNLTSVAVVAMVGALGLLGPQMGCSNKSIPTAPAPVISSFIAAHSVTAGAPTTQLIAVYTGGGGSLDHQNASGTSNSIFSGVPFAVSVTEPTTYTLLVTNANGKTVSAKVTVDVISLASKVSTVDSGSAAQLIATFAQGTGVIDHGVGPVTSGVPIAAFPTKGTDYTLTVTLPSGGAASISTPVSVTKIPVSNLADLSLTSGTISTAGFPSKYMGSKVPVNCLQVGEPVSYGDGGTCVRYFNFPCSTEDYVEYQFPSAATVDHSAVYWWDDSGDANPLVDNNGGVSAPSSYRIQYWDAATSAWVDVANPQTEVYDAANSWFNSLPPSSAVTPTYYRELGVYNYVGFTPVTTTALRMVLQPRAQTGSNGDTGFVRSIGIFRWKVFKTTY